MNARRVYCVKHIPRYNRTSGVVAGGSLAVTVPFRSISSLSLKCFQCPSRCGCCWTKPSMRFRTSHYDRHRVMRTIFYRPYLCHGTRSAAQVCASSFISSGAAATSRTSGNTVGTLHHAPQTPTTSDSHARTSSKHTASHLPSPQQTNIGTTAVASPAAKWTKLLYTSK